MYFRESNGGLGQLVDTNTSLQTLSTDIRQTPCIPITTMLLALNQTRVDFLSLDVQGFELPILQTLHWDLIDIRSIAVEYLLGQKAELRQYLESRGYTFIKDIRFHHYPSNLYVDDFIFVKQ